MSGSKKYQLLRPMGEDELTALRASIEEEGPQDHHPVVYDQDGNLIVGHHRVQVYEKLGITKYPRTTRTFASDAERYRFILRDEMARRHLSPYDKQQMVTTAHELFPDWSVRDIAAYTGISKSSVQRYLSPADDTRDPWEVGADSDASVPDGTAEAAEGTHGGRNEDDQPEQAFVPDGTVDRPRQRRGPRIRIASPETAEVEPAEPGPTTVEIIPPNIEERVRQWVLAGVELVEDHEAGRLVVDQYRDDAEQVWAGLSKLLGHRMSTRRP